MTSTQIDGPWGGAHVWSAGPEDGRSVLLIHGVHETADVWHQVGLELADRGNRVVAPDLPGRGRSEWDGQPLEMAAQVRHLLDIMDKAALRGAVHVVSHSDGDIVALSLAASIPERVRTVSLIAPSGALPRTASNLPLSARLRWLGSLGEGALKTKLVRGLLDLRSSLSAAGTPAVDAMLVALEQPRSVKAILSQVRCWPSVAEMLHTAGLLSELRLPILGLRYADESGANTVPHDDVLAALTHGVWHTVVADSPGGVLGSPDPTVERLEDHLIGRRNTP